MADTKLTIFQSDATTAAIDYRTEASNGDGRQVIVIGDPSVNVAVSEVLSREPGPTSTNYGAVVRMAGSISVGGFTGSVRLTGIYESIAVYFDRGNPAVNVTGGSGTLGVYIDSTKGTLAVKLDPAAYALVNAFHTASLFNTSSSYAGNSLSGGTIISPSANASFKIFAFSLSTTAQSNILAKFTNGAGTGPTEYWRVALQAPAQGISGANLAVTPPGHLWATGTSTTLSLVLDSASLVHYSVSYIKETA